MNPPRRRNRYNNPSVVYAAVDALASLLIFYLLMGIFPFGSDEPLKEYSPPFLVFLLWWVFLGIAFRKYLNFKKRTLPDVVKNCFQVGTVASLTTMVILLVFPSLDYSVYFLITVSFIIFIVELMVISVYFAFRDAEVQDGETDRNRPVHEEEVNRRSVHPVDDEVREFVSSYIVKHRGEELLFFLRENAGLFYASTLLINTVERFSIEKVSKARYVDIINLHGVNDIREINYFFATVNDRIPYGGFFVGCYESLSQRRRRIIGNKHRIHNGLIYTKDFIVNRMLPKLNLTRELYFWITGGKDRALSKAEVFGRVYFAGFEITQEAEINGLSYFIARKIKEPVQSEEINYSIVLSLQRIGKRKEQFKVYKLRTMYPYSSYLQDYVYANNHLDEGGKFRRDFRITTLGHFMRRYWLDELPMLVNLLKGDMKLVGVRPLSNQYFSLYSPQLQQQRVRHRPGLLPPFYADMPGSLDEIQASEKKYLDQCERRGTFVTDIRYLFVILFNILFKKARSK